MSAITHVMNAGNIAHRIAALESKQQEESGGSRSEHTSVGADGIRILNGGTLTIEGGQLVLKNDTGVDLVFIGNVSDVNGTSRGWIFHFDNGRACFALEGAPGRQYFTLRDPQADIVVSSDGVSGHGLARPYLPMRLVPTFDAQQDGTSLWPSTAAGSATKLWQGTNPLFHPKLSIGVTMAGAGGTGHWRLDIDGSTVLSDETSGGNHDLVVPGWGNDIKPGDDVIVEIYGWVTSGPGRTYIQCDRLYGRESV